MNTHQSFESLDDIPTQTYVVASTTVDPQQALTASQLQQQKIQQQKRSALLLSQQRNSANSSKHISTDDSDDDLDSEFEDEQLLQYRKEAYLKMKASATNLILKPFLIGMSVAMGMSFGYAFYDYVASVVSKKK